MINQTRAKYGAHKAAAVWERLGTCAWLRLFLDYQHSLIEILFLFHFISFSVVWPFRRVIEKNIEHFYWMEDAIGGSHAVFFFFFFFVSFIFHFNNCHTSMIRTHATSNDQRIMWSISFSNLTHWDALTTSKCRQSSHTSPIKTKIAENCRNLLNVFILRKFKTVHEKF